MSSKDLENAGLRQRLEELERHTQQLEYQNEELKQRTELTTLIPFLIACHQHLHVPLSVETDVTLTSKGDYTDPTGKFHPKYLKRWIDFPRVQKTYFDQAYSICCPQDAPPPKVFSPLISLEDIGKNYCNVRIGDEDRLRTYINVALEAPVTSIIKEVISSSQAHGEFRLGTMVAFQNHYHSLSDKNSDVRERQNVQLPRTPPPPPRSQSRPNTGSAPKTTHADQFCVFKDQDGQRQLMLIVEYKPPHKYSINSLEAGFRDMSLKTEVIDRFIYPDSKSPDYFQFKADKICAAAAAQTFHYMIENGLEYGYITSGQTFVFLRIKKDDPQTLYYHVSVPSSEIHNQRHNFLHDRTAISQIVSFILMASQSEPRNQIWRVEAKKHLRTWHVDDNYIMDRLPESEVKVVPSSNYKGKQPDSVDKKSSRVLRSQLRCSSQDLPEIRQDYSDESDEPMDGSPLPSRRLEKSSTGKKKSDGNSQQVQGQSNNQYQYCTQKCLLGLTQGRPIDQKCPNSLFHSEHAMQHAIDRSEFLELVQKQLARDLDHDCEPLNLVGARGALFKIRLASHGYVFVGKGTVEAFLPDLWHEGQIYRWLKSLQGTAVPVYLGSIDLIEYYHLDLGVTILHMLFMSWGGQMIDQDEVAKTLPNLTQETDRTLAEVEDMGILHGDIRSPNLLWNQESQRVMLVDFERAGYYEHLDKTTPAIQDEALTKSSTGKNRKRLQFRARKPKHIISFKWPSTSKKQQRIPHRQRKRRTALSPYFNRNQTGIFLRDPLSPLSS